MVAGRAHEASAITFREAKEGSLEAHNFSSKASMTLTHSKNEKKWDTTLVATAKSLAKLMFSIGTTTFKVTEEKMEESEEEDTSIEEKVERNKKRVAIKGMGMLDHNNSKAMLSETGEEDQDMSEEKPKDSEPKESKENKFEGSDDEMKRAGADLTA